ncbi:hypothetical protein [Pseudozobellia thermophila]|uniref:Uncharacterized protein n=1 Tax=Pseudozobellia thermophila TaxID=192903 RepID=A0A1M6NME7_9FLAO|nr:hypothetical protein [Pseudozobellia thermophila]SHJ96890.1 hypothetical protein SAMN04488513_11426 [Pseudozobellia thermophila]
MNENIISEIVIKAFEKAKAEHISHSKHGLSQYISDHTGLSTKTLERAYDKYVAKSNKCGIPQSASVDILCQFLGFEGYTDYIKKSRQQSHSSKPVKRTVENNSPLKRKRILFYAMGVIGILLIVFFVSGSKHKKMTDGRITTACMTWADSLYVKYSCDEGPYSTWGTKVIPFNDYLFKNMKKVKVDAAYTFFNHKKEPLVWYHKKSDSEIEFYKSPGLHPINGKTLKHITPYIIQKYVSLHKNDNDSFIK